MTKEERTPALELLLPEGPAARELGRRVTTFLRLLVDDARSRAGGAVGIDLDVATVELARDARRDLLDAFEELLRHHVGALHGSDAFSGPPAPGLPVQEAWSVLERHRGSPPGGAELPAVPAPGESPADVVRRLLVAMDPLEEGARAESWRRAWEARLVGAERGPAEGERAWRALLEGEKDVGRAVECAHGVAAALLDRGAVRAARTFLDDRLALAGVDEGLAWLLAWTHLLLGEPEEAAELVHGLAPPAVRLPTPLVELRAACPEWTRLLPGRPADPGAGGVRGAGDVRAYDRAALGASVLGVFRLGPARTLEVVHIEVAPALRPRVDGFLRDRDGACAQPAEPEHELFSTARPVVRHRGTERLRGTLDPCGSRSLALAPVHDDDGEVAAWVHLEWEHHLVPARERLVAIGSSWRAALERPRAGRGGTSATPASGHDPRSDAARSLVARTGMKFAQRRWSVLDATTDPPVVVAAGGGALRDGAAGGGRAVRRARTSGAVVAFPEPDPRLALCKEAASGLAVPVVFAGEVHAVLALESARRRDFREADAVRLRQAGLAFGATWRAAQFRAWHRERFGHDVFLDPEGSAFGARVLALAASARSRAPLAFVGREGSGRGVLARWVHFAGPRAALGLVRVEPDAPPPEEGFGAETETGTLFVPALDRRSAAWQAAFERALSAPGSRARPRVVASLERPLAAAVAAGDLRPGLAHAFGRLEVGVPPLRERRDEIPGLVRLLLRRFAEEEGLRAPELEDSALALLWRQPWEGHVRQLAALAYRLVVFHPGASLDGPRVAGSAARLGLELQRRLPSRRPDPRDVEGALRLTARASGAPNKTRAALYLGWDPDTLVARMRESRGRGQP